MRLRYKSLATKATAARGRNTRTIQQTKAAYKNAYTQTVKQSETSKGSWWDKTESRASAFGTVAVIAVCAVVQPFLDVLSFAAGIVSAIYDDSPFKAIVKAQGDSAQGNYAAPFGRQNAFAAGRGVGHAVSIVGGIVEVVAGGALVSGGTAVTTTGVLAPAGVAAVAGGAAIAAAGVARVVTTVAAVSAGDPNFQFSTSTSGGAAGNSNSGHMLGENGTQVRGSRTTGQKGKTERVDVENPAPGNRPGDIHYHDSDNIKWRYDINLQKLVDPATGELAPPKVQKVLEEEWVRKAIGKALNILGE